VVDTSEGEAVVVVDDMGRGSEKDHCQEQDIQLMKSLGSAPGLKRPECLDFFERWFREPRKLGVITGYSTLKRKQ